MARRRRVGAERVQVLDQQERQPFRLPIEPLGQPRVDGRPSCAQQLADLVHAQAFEAVRRARVRGDPAQRMLERRPPGLK